MNYHSTKRLPYGGTDLDKLMASLLEQRGLRCSDPQRLKELCARASSLPSSSEVYAIVAIVCVQCLQPDNSEQMSYDIALMTSTADHAGDVAAMLCLQTFGAKIAHGITPAASCHLCAHISFSNICLLASA